MPGARGSGKFLLSRMAPPLDLQNLPDADVVVLAQNVKDEDLKMIIGSGCEVVDDLASALYRVVGRLPPA